MFFGRTLVSVRGVCSGSPPFCSRSCSRSYTRTSYTRTPPPAPPPPYTPPYTPPCTPPPPTPLYTPPSPPLYTLAFESSCDDSSVAIVAAHPPSPPRIVSLHTISQHTTNAVFGGVHPLHAQRLHAANLPRCLAHVVRHAAAQGIHLHHLHAVAYTRGPGMRGCLAVSEHMAKSLAAALGKPLLGVHHMHAHALTPLLSSPTPPAFPFLILLVSGGHTQLVLALGIFHFRILLDTLDSKIGDVFEKAARMLQLPPSPTTAPGAVLEQYASLAAQHPPLDPLPIPLSTGHAKHRLAFSFAGLLSALATQTDAIKSTHGLTRPFQIALASLIQTGLTRHLVSKVTQAIHALPPELVQTLGGMVVAGGVARNRYVRQELTAVSRQFRLGHNASTSNASNANAAGIGHNASNAAGIAHNASNAAGIGHNASNAAGIDHNASNASNTSNAAGIVHNTSNTSNTSNACGIDHNTSNAASNACGQVGRGEDEGQDGMWFPPGYLCTDNAAMIAHTAILRLTHRDSLGSEIPLSDPYDLEIRPKWSLEDLYDDVPGWKGAMPRSHGKSE